MLGLGTGLTAEQRLTKNVVKIMNAPRYRALAGIVMIGERSVSDDIPTACTNGRDEWYGRTWIEEHTDAEVRFGIVHECGHKMYKHSKLLKHLWDRDAQCANMAADYVINLEIVDENPDGFCKMPEGCLYDEQYRGMDTTKVFWLLYDAQEDDGEDDGDDDGEGGSGQSGSGSGEPSSPVWDEHQWDKDLLSDEETKDLDREIDQAIRQGAMAAGKMGADGGARNLDELLQPQVDWRSVMQEFVQDSYAGNDYATYDKPNRRFIASGIYMPSGVSDQMGELVNANDMSASVGDKEVQIIKSELVDMAVAVSPEKLHVLYWDTEVMRHEEYKQDELEDLEHQTKPHYGGGTDVRCVPTYIENKDIHAQCAVVITDGDLYCGWGEWDCPVLWVIIDNKNATPDCGTVLHVTSSQLRS